MQTKQAPLLDNITNNCVESAGLPAELLTAINAKYTYKVSQKAYFAKQMRNQIQDYFQTQGVLVSRGLAVNEDGELVELESNLPENDYFLYRFWKRLGLNESIYALFEHEGKKAAQVLATRYSMHSLCPLWNYRRSQIIRKRYNDFFRANLGILQDYQPAHLVLTLKHNNEGYFIDNQLIKNRFFARDLIKEFKKLRDNNREQWNEYFYAGTYNIEVKKNDNGLHIHLHSLCFINPQYSLNEVRDWINREWRIQTGATQTWLESLYYFDKTETQDNFNQVIETYDPDTHSYIYEPAQKRKKVYFSKDWTIEQTTYAIMECLKYNFKMEALYQESAQSITSFHEQKFDIDFIREILNNSYRLRFTSRFGAFYRVKELNFNEVKDEALPFNDIENEVFDYIQERAEEFRETPESFINLRELHLGIEFDIMQERKKIPYTEADFRKAFENVENFINQKAGINVFEGINIHNSFQNLINPFTLEPELAPNLQLALPSQLLFWKKDDKIDLKYKKDNFFAVEPDTPKELVKNLMCFRFSNIVKFEDYERFKANYYPILYNNELI
jgi:hypothetical protein